MWTERDEIQRLDLVASVVIATALVAAVVALTLLLTAHLGQASQIILWIGSGLFAVVALCALASLDWSPFRGDDPVSVASVKDTMVQKRKRTRLALWVLIFSIMVTFAVAVIVSPSNHKIDTKTQRYSQGHAEYP
jgi:type VI protein secretion system component VasF